MRAYNRKRKPKHHCKTKYNHIRARLPFSKEFFDLGIKRKLGQSVKKYSRTYKKAIMSFKFDRYRVVEWRD